MQQPLSSLSRAKSKHMLYEIPIAGVQVAGFVILAIGSLTATTAICALIERFQLVEWVWNPPLFSWDSGPVWASVLLCFTMAREAKSLIAFLVTGSLLALAVILAWLLYTEYYSNPWTRDAHVRANVIEIAPRVAGPIVSLAVSDNALVQRGQLLFEIDPSDYHNALAIAQSVFDQRQAELVNAQAAFDRSQRLLGTKVISKGENDAATATFESAKALYEGSFAALRQAKLNLEYTKVYAPATGYVSGVTFGLGTYVQTGKPVFVLIDRESYWVTALFKETVLPSLTPGRPVSIRFAPRPGQEFHGTIESLGWGISDNDAGYSMSLPSIAPTVDWVRLTQRYPVRIRLGADALKLPLKIGVTASVRVLGVPGQLNP